jgi:hypothetical protein
MIEKQNVLIWRLAENVILAAKAASMRDKIGTA